MLIIGVIDLLSGQAVHARGGRRDEYAPVAAAAGVTIAGDAAALARLYVQRLDVSELYVADLDAIAGRALQDPLIAAVAATGAPLWLDAGITSVEQARHALALGASRLVIGLETLRSYDDLAAICAAAGGDAVALSIDLRNGLPIRAAGTDVDERPEEIAVRAVRAGVGALIVLDLARVGTLDGPDVPLIAAVRRAALGAMLLAAGGVRDPEDLDRLADAGCDGALVATALHEGRIGPGRQKSVQPRSVRRSV